MTQQETNREEPLSSYGVYSPSDANSFQLSRQKLIESASNKSVSSGHRLTLAIASLVLLSILFITITITVSITAVDALFPAIAICSICFFLAVCCINYLFNHKN